MTQKEYIRKLRSGLAFFVSENELNDIVSDFEEVFSDSMTDGKSEEQVCSSLGSPKEAAKNILLEKGVKVSTGKTIAKASVFAIITAVSMYFLWNDVCNSVYFIPFLPLALLIFMENGRLTRLTEKGISVTGIASCIIPMINLFLFPTLVDLLFWNRLSALLPAAAAITIVTAASLAFAMLSVKSNPYGKVIPVMGAAASLCIVILQVYAALGIGRKYYIDIGEDIRIQQIAYRARYINIIVTALFITGIIIFVISAFRRDTSSLPCMYASLGMLILLSRECDILRKLDISSDYKSILYYVPTSLWTTVIYMVILSIIVTVFLVSRKAKSNG